MKKTLLLTLFAAFATFAYSQEISWNAKAGVNVSNIAGDDNTEFKVGYHVGVGMNICSTTCGAYSHL